MFKFFKKKKVDMDEEQAAKNLARAASVSTVDRRAHVRVSYPPVGKLGSLPAIEFQGQPVRPTNISLGGMLLTGRNIDLMTGQEYEFKFSWAESPDGVLQKARLLRVSGMNYHFKFDNLATDLIVKCSLAFRPGERGNKIQHVDELPPDSANIVELWANNSGDYIAYCVEGKNSSWEIGYCNRRYRVLVDGKVHELKEQGQEVSGETVSQFICDDLSLFASNVRRPSKAIMDCAQALQGR